MKAELLLQFIVPLTFLAIWALTSLLNRDAQPLPPRPGRVPGPGGGPRPGLGAPLAGQVESAGSSRPLGTSRPLAAERPAPARWSGPPTQGRPLSAGRTGGPDEGIVILESENRPSSASTSSFSPSSAASVRSTRATTTARRTTSRGRATPAAAPKPVEPERHRVLTGLVSQPLAPKKGRALEIAPLSTPLSPLGSPLTQVSQQTIPIPPHATTNRPIPTLTSSDLRTMLASPAKLREIALLGELLQPPVSLRAPRRPR